MTNEAYLRRKWFGGRDTAHLTFTAAVELTMQKKYEWVGLTEEDMDCLFPHGSSVWVQETVKIIEAKLKEKNL